MTYGYDANGIRNSVLDQIDSNGDGVWEQQIQTEYLNDPENFTGYSQVLRETHTNSTTGQVTEVIDYTWGLQGIAQTVTTYANGLPTGSTTEVFGLDGHGSVRVLTNMAAAIAQLYEYDAYGNMQAIYNGAGQFVSSKAANALTTYLYSGQQFTPQTGLMDCSARQYQPSTGTFTTIDPVTTVQESSYQWNPTYQNTYIYTADDPVDFGDPSGNFPVPALLGTFVHTFLSSQFEAGVIPGTLRFGNRWVSTIVKRLTPMWWFPPLNLRPDAVEVFPATLTADVYEFKHADFYDASIDYASHCFGGTEAAGYTALLASLVTTYSWARGTTLWAPVRFWPTFWATPPGHVLVTFNTSAIVSGSIIYDFLPISDEGMALSLAAELADAAVASAVIYLIAQQAQVTTVVTTTQAMVPTVIAVEEVDVQVSTLAA